MSEGGDGGSGAISMAMRQSDAAHEQKSGGGGDSVGSVFELVRGMADVSSNLVGNVLASLGSVSQLPSILLGADNVKSFTGFDIIGWLKEASGKLAGTWSPSEAVHSAGGAMHSAGVEYAGEANHSANISPDVQQSHHHRGSDHDIGYN